VHLYTVVQKTDSAYSALTLLVGRQEGHPACKNFAPESLNDVTLVGGVQAVVPNDNIYPLYGISLVVPYDNSTGPTCLSTQPRGNRFTQVHVEMAVKAVCVCPEKRPLSVKPGFRALHIPTKKAEFNVKWSFTVIQGHVFWGQSKGDKGLNNTI